MHIKNFFVGIFTNFHRLLAEPLKGYLKDTFLVSGLNELIGSHSENSEIIILQNGEAVLKYIIGPEDSVIASISKSVIDRVRNTLNISVLAIGEGKLSVEAYVDDDQIIPINLRRQQRPD